MKKWEVHVICSIETVERLKIVMEKGLGYALTIATSVLVFATFVHLQLPTVLFVHSITIETIDLAITDLSPVEA